MRKPRILRPVVESDVSWIPRLFDQSGLINQSGKYLFYRTLKNTNQRDRFECICPFGFIHYRISVKNIITVYEIVVDEKYRGVGFGEMIVRLVCEACGVRSLKAKTTDAKNFWEKLGLSVVDTYFSDTKQKTVYVMEGDLV